MDGVRMLATTGAGTEVKVGVIAPERPDAVGRLVRGASRYVACLAGASSLTGHATTTLIALKLSDADPASPAAERLWALTVEGEVAARLGRNAEAEDAFKRARAIAP